MGLQAETQGNASPLEFDLTRSLLGHNLKLRNQLSAEKIKFLEDQDIVLATWFPHSSLGPEGIIATGDVYADSYRAFGLERISRIAQVGEIAFSEEELALPDFINLQSRAFSSTTRWDHCLTTGIILELMLRNNHCAERDIATGIIGGLLHDAAITPFSDMISGLDLKGLDEAENLPLYIKTLDKSRLDAFSNNYTPDYAKILEIVKGKGGSLGTLLKIADRLAYTACDSSVSSAVLRHKRKASSKSDGNPMNELVDIFENNPKLFDIFREVKIDPQSDNVYFEDSRKMALFLRVRAIMFAHFYLNPQRLNFQAVVRKTVKVMMDEGALGVDDFLRMTDIEMRVKLYPHMRFNHKEIYEKVGFVKGKTMGEVVKSLKKEGVSSERVFWADDIAKFDTLSHWMVRDSKRGKIMPFSKACPKETKGLEDLSRRAQGFVVYFVKPGYEL